MLISNIQRFSLHDGPGIRTTVFFMGCPLRCPWCCNPENLTAQIKSYSDNNGIIQQYGKEYSIEELEQEILKDKDYFDDGGGITYSGGECLLQLKNMVPLLEKFHKEKIHQCIESSLSVEPELLKQVAKYIDLFYVDLKILDKKTFKDKLNGDLDYLIANLDYLKKNNKKYIFRIPLVNNYTTNDDNLQLIKSFIKKYQPMDIEMFAVHNMGKQKYINLGLNYTDFETLSQDEINEIKSKLQ